MKTLQHLRDRKWKSGARVLAAIAATALLFASEASYAGFAYTMTIKSSIPTGGAGTVKPTATNPWNGGNTIQWPSTTPFTPCTSTTPPDLVNFSMSYNAGTAATATAASTLKDVYMIMISPTGTYYFITKNYLTGATLTPKADTVALTAFAHAGNSYLPAAQNPGGAFANESLIASSLYVDGVTTGTWQLVGIVADANLINFDDPSTWIAFDTASVVLGSPWPLNARANVTGGIAAGSAPATTAAVTVNLPAVTAAANLNAVVATTTGSYTVIETADGVYHGPLLDTTGAVPVLAASKGGGSGCE